MSERKIGDHVWDNTSEVEAWVYAVLENGYVLTYSNPASGHLVYRTPGEVERLEIALATELPDLTLDEIRQQVIGNGEIDSQDWDRALAEHDRQLGERIARVVESTFMLPGQAEVAASIVRREAARG